MKPELKYINNIAKYENKGYYMFAGGRGSAKSALQLELMRRIIKLLDDIDACNRELAKIERRKNDRTN